MRQFRYYLVDAGTPKIARRFRLAVAATISSLSVNPFVAPGYPLRNRRLRDVALVARGRL